MKKILLDKLPANKFREERLPKIKKSDELLKQHYWVAM